MLFRSPRYLLSILRWKSPSKARTFSSAATKGELSNQPKSFSVLFFGTDHYAVFALEALLKRTAEPHSTVLHRLGVCSRFAKPASEVAKFVEKVSAEKNATLEKNDTLEKNATLEKNNTLEKNGVVISSFEYSLDFQPTGWDVGVVASFGHLIPPEIIAAFPYGMLCIHPSFLPRFRGASPLMQTILNNETFSGVSLMRIMPSKFDVGPILKQEIIAVPENVTSRKLGKKLMKNGIDLLIDVFSKNLPAAILQATPQSNEGVSYAKKITLKKTFIDWSWSVEKIDCFQRAILEDFSVRTFWEKKTTKLTGFLSKKTVASLSIDELCPRTADSKYGELFFHKKRDVLFVRCGNGWVGVTGILLSDRRPMTAKDFFNGFLSADKNRQHFFTTENNSGTDFGKETE